ncbi:MAG: ABC transporter permease, partial [Gaiellaceae bacterium]
SPPWVTLPLSKAGILAGAVIIALPMFGDYYTPDLLSGSPKTNLVGNQINLFIHGPQPTVGAALTVLLMSMLAVLMAYYLITTARMSRADER